MARPQARFWSIPVADVAVLGMGRMGAAMARKLVAAGHAVVVWNRSPAATKQVVEQIRTAEPTSGSVRIATDAADAVAGAEFVVSMLASGVVTEQVLLSPDVLAALTPGAIVCDMGTSGVPAAHALDAAISNAGCSFVDAPVSGSVPTVDAGQLLIMAGGRPDDVAAVAPVSEHSPSRSSTLATPAPARR